jgi:hypothetical protein
MLGDSLLGDVAIILGAFAFMIGISVVIGRWFKRLHRHYPPTRQDDE